LRGKVTELIRGRIRQYVKVNKRKIKTWVRTAGRLTVLEKVLTDREEVPRLQFTVLKWETAAVKDLPKKEEARTRSSKGQKTVSLCQTL